MLRVGFSIGDYLFLDSKIQFLATVKIEAGPPFNISPHPDK
jgi:hypothetical protein